jgi:hypothetical protein
MVQFIFFFYICEINRLREKGMALDIQKWYDKVIKEEIIFLFHGEISSTLITDSLEEIENKLEPVPNQIKKKIYNILVECLQNLYHHSATSPINGSSKFSGKVGVCAVFKNGSGYHIITGNYVEPKQKIFLTGHLNKINTLDKEDLKLMYKEILDNQEFSEKGGGGLGMVDIARKSGNKLNYNFIEINNNLHFFTLDINIIE